MYPRSIVLVERIEMGVYLYEMRPKQWTKNLLVYAALLFGGSLFQEGAFLRATLAFMAFCFVSSGVYFFNDIYDAPQDRQNPQKCTRPIAAGRIGIKTAYVMATGLFALGLCLASWLNAYCLGIIALYVVMNLAYTMKLKHIVIIDVMIIALGFVLRALMGVVAVGTGVTMWFLLCVMFLSLFLALGKRRHELLAVENSPKREGRKVLRFYSKGLIDQLMTIVTAALLICYALFTMDNATKNHEAMALTIPLALYGVFYYLYVVRVKRSGGAPDEALYKEKPILAVVVFYVLAIVLIRNW